MQLRDKLTTECEERFTSCRALPNKEARVLRELPQLLTQEGKSSAQRALQSAKRSLISLLEEEGGGGYSGVGALDKLPWGHRESRVGPVGHWQVSL